MKSISVAIAIAVVYTCICIFESTAVPFSEMRVEETGKSDVPVEEQQQQLTAASAEETHPLALFRTKRHHSHLSLCRWCCNCCHNKGCGFCCKF